MGRTRFLIAQENHIVDSHAQKKNKKKKIFLKNPSCFIDINTVVRENWLTA